MYALQLCNSDHMIRIVLLKVLKAEPNGEDESAEAEGVRSGSMNEMILCGSKIIQRAVSAHGVAESSCTDGV